MKKKDTPEIRENRAREIASLLGKADKWHSHGRGISMKELRGEEIKLEIDDFEDKPSLNDVIRNYHGLAIDYAVKSGIRGFIHTKKFYGHWIVQKFYNIN